MVRVHAHSQGVTARTAIRVVSGCLGTGDSAFGGRSSGEMIQRQPAWYCIRTLRWREEQAYGSLRQFREIETFFPRLRSLTVISSRGEPSVEPLFAGHLFAYFPIGLLYRRVRQCQGVKCVVSFMGAWPSISDADMEELRRAFGPGEIMDRPTRRLEPGTLVDVASGPLRGFRSVIYYDMPSAQRVNLLIQLLRRSLNQGYSGSGIQ